MASEFVLIHLIVADDAGPIVSDGGPPLHPEATPGFDRPLVGVPGHYRLACNSRKGRMGIDWMATDMPHLVNCPDCIRSQIFEEKAKAHPFMIDHRAKLAALAPKPPNSG